MRSPLKQAVKAHYEKKNLTEGQLQKLLDLQQVEKPKRFSRFHFISFAVAAAALVLLLNISYFTKPSYNIVQEVAYNHNKQMNPEIYSDSIAKIQNRLNRLDFNMINAEFLGDGWEVLGGRYCSIQGKVAAQLKVKEKASGKVYTLYQARLPAGFSQDKQQIKEIDGLTVKVWIEKGLIMALAG